MTAPSLAVLVTYHNERALLAESIGSVLPQLGGTDEVLVYDDASQFPARDHCLNDRRVRVIRGEQNRGPAHGRNVMLRASRADYVHFHDCDDLFREGWAQRTREAISRSRPDAIFTEIRSSTDGAVTLERVLGIAAIKSNTDLTRFCIGGSLLTAGTYRREWVLRAGGYNEQLGQSEDYEFHIRVAVANPKFVIIDEPLVEIRRRPESRSNSSRDVFRDAIHAVALVRPVVPSPLQPALAAACVGFARSLYQLDDAAGAAEGFKLACAIAPRPYNNQPYWYRLAARWLGPDRAERFGAAYRRLPETLRKALHAR